MPCNVFGGSCSLCPWCGEEQCPHYHDHDNDKRYWVYATDREGGFHVMQANLDTKKEVIAYVKKLVNKKWAKKYKWAYNCQEVGKRCENEYLPWVELTITDGEYSWYDSVDLLINTEEKTIWYFDKWRTKFHEHPDEHRNIELVKKWDNKLNFIYMENLPWYPTKEEWEARRNSK